MLHNMALIRQEPHQKGIVAVQCQEVVDINLACLWQARVTDEDVKRQARRSAEKPHDFRVVHLPSLELR